MSGPGIKSDCSRTAHTRILTRIIVALNAINKSVNTTEIKNSIVGVRNSKTLRDGLHWLVCNKIINKIHACGSEAFSYQINPKWKELKDGKEE